MAYVPPTLRQAVAERARYRCEYCQSPKRITGGPLHVEHVIPETSGGPIGRVAKDVLALRPRALTW